MYRNKREDGRGFGKSSDNVCYRGSTLHFISIKIEIISVLNWVFYTFGSSYHLFTKDIQGYLSIPEHYRFQHSFPNISWRSLAGDDQKWEMWNKKEKSEKDPASKTMNSVKWPNSVSCLLPHPVYLIRYLHSYQAVWLAFEEKLFGSWERGWQILEYFMCMYLVNWIIPLEFYIRQGEKAHRQNYGI